MSKQGYVWVRPTFQSEFQPDLFAVGDATRFPAGSALPKTWMLTRRQAPLVARNLVAHARGEELSHFDAAKARKSAGMAVPDGGGQTVVVKNGRVLASGRWPLLMRALVDRRTLKARR